MKKNIVYIHGANSSPRSFKYIQKTLPEHNILNISYSVDTPLRQNTFLIKKTINEEFGDEKISFICHSLGGLIALKLHHNHNVERTLTMSAPFGGSKIVEYFRWICPTYQMFEDVKTTSSVIRELKNMSFNKPIYSIVTTSGGNPLLGEPNDGTITIRSQMAVRGPKYEKISLNHFEVLLSDRVVSKISGFLF